MTRASMLSNLELQGEYLSLQKNKPNARAMSAVFKAHNRLYMFGGLSNKKLEDFWVCDLKRI